MFQRLSGKHNVEYFPKKASTAFEIGDLVYPDGSGAVQPADSTSGGHIGVIMKKIASSDSDYASTTKVPVDVPGPNDVFIADVGAGSATSALIGTHVDLTDADSVDVGSTSKQVVLVVGVISTSKVLVKINALATAKDVATS